MKLKWGILSTAKIALEKIIPAMAEGHGYELYGIASRNLEKAQKVAAKENIKAYGSYEELIADPEIDIIYNPLPNHLHFTYTLKCIEAGKHVLCEKPIALKSSDVEKLIAARDAMQVKVGEAFMVKTHPQWLKAKELVQQGSLGKISLVQGIFSYNNTDANNIRNIEAYGGGAIWDIGCYPVTTSRFVLGEEPTRVIALTEFDKAFGTDKLSSVILDFPSAQVTFAVGTQIVPYQRMHFFGTKKRLEILIPFNAPKDRLCPIKVDDGNLFGENVEQIAMGICDQYKLQMDAFSDAVRTNENVPVTLEDALKNTKVLEAIFQSAKEGKWISIEGS